MIDVNQLEQKLNEAGINEDDMFEVCQALDPILNLVRKYDKKYLAKILAIILELLLEEKGDLK